MPRKKKKTDQLQSNRPPFHESLKGFDIRVNSFGQMESTFEIDKLNDFLNKEKEDKKTAKPDKTEEE
jgi:hypothetical protein